MSRRPPHEPSRARKYRQQHGPSGTCRSETSSAAPGALVVGPTPRQSPVAFSGQCFLAMFEAVRCIPWARTGCVRCRSRAMLRLEAARPAHRRWCGGALRHRRRARSRQRPGTLCGGWCHLGPRRVRAASAVGRPRTWCDPRRTALVDRAGRGHEAASSCRPTIRAAALSASRASSASRRATTAAGSSLPSSCACPAQRLITSGSPLLRAA